MTDDEILEAAKAIRAERKRVKTRERTRKYLQTPGVKWKRREYMSGYFLSPEVKAKRREYQQRPEVKARRKKYHRAYQRRPEVKARAFERRIFSDQVAALVEYEGITKEAARARVRAAA